MSLTFKSDDTFTASTVTSESGFQMTLNFQGKYTLRGNSLTMTYTSLTVDGAPADLKEIIEEGYKKHLPGPTAGEIKFNGPNEIVSTDKGKSSTMKRIR